MTKGAADATLIQERIAFVERVFPSLVSRRPDFWSDVEVRRFLIAQWSFLTVRQARERLAADYGPGRVPSKSSIDRFWQHLKKMERRR